MAVAGTPKKPAAGADIKATDPDQPHIAAVQSDIALDGQLQQFVTAPQGLFPAPLPSHLAADSLVLNRFKLLGRAMAKALQDNRLLDLPLSYVFYRCASHPAFGELEHCGLCHYTTPVSWSCSEGLPAAPDSP